MTLFSLNTASRTYESFDPRTWGNKGPGWKIPDITGFGCFRIKAFTFPNNGNLVFSWCLLSVNKIISNPPKWMMNTFNVKHICLGGKLNYLWDARHSQVFGCHRAHASWESTSMAKKRTDRLHEVIQLYEENILKLSTISKMCYCLVCLSFHSAALAGSFHITSKQWDASMQPTLTGTVVTHRETYSQQNTQRSENFVPGIKDRITFQKLEEHTVKPKQTFKKLLTSPS